MTDNALSAAQQYYFNTVKSMVELYRYAEVSNLRRLHDLGKLFSDFKTRAAREEDEDFTVDHLVADLRAAGAFPDIVHPRRMLYWGLSFYENYPDIATLEDLAARGFTATHVKQLLMTTAETRKVVEGKMFTAAGRIVSTRELVDIISQETKGAVDARIELLEQDGIITVEPTAVPRAVAVPYVEPAGITYHAEEEDVVVDATPTADEAIPDAGPTATPVPVGANPSAAGEKVYTKAPSAVIKACGKTLTKVQNQMADLAIAVREFQQIGYNSDPQLKKVQGEFRELRADMQKTVQLIDAMDKAIADEQSSWA